MFFYLTFREQLINHQPHNVWPAAIVHRQDFAPKGDTCPYSLVIVSDLSSEKVSMAICRGHRQPQTSGQSTSGAFLFSSHDAK
jgi:hypothetical protein